MINLNVWSFQINDTNTLESEYHPVQVVNEIEIIFYALVFDN
jgi:hypothetical protein